MLICFLKIVLLIFDPDFYNFCNFAHKPLDWLLSTELKCLQKLDACFHSHKEIESFLLQKVNVLFI